jgi:hypothetical protein
LLSRLPSASIPRRYAEEGASISIKGMELTAYSVRSAPAFGSSSYLALSGAARRLTERAGYAQHLLPADRGPAARSAA